MTRLLDVRNLTVSHNNTRVPLPLVDNVSFTSATGSVLAVVGESGSGKTTLCRALTRLFPDVSRISVNGAVEFDSTDLLHCDAEALRQIRQTRIRYVFQEPQQALNPVLTIRRQMEFATGKKSISFDVFVPILISVGLDNPVEVLKSYPHQLSIGMAQRVMIAMAILPNPALLIADEPTSSVDASLRYQLLDILKSLQQQNNMAMILVTHDLEVARRYADEVLVMQKGKVIEHRKTKEFFENPQQSYSQMLLAAMPGVHKRVMASSDLTVGK